jgi:hypothetical protein
MKVSEEDYVIGASADRGRAVFGRWYAFRGGARITYAGNATLMNLWIV